MPENDHDETQTSPPHAQLAQMATAYWVSDIVYVAAKLSLADHLAEGPRPVFLPDLPLLSCSKT